MCEIWGHPEVMRHTLTGGKRVEAVEDILSVGQKLQVEIAEIDDRGKLSLIPVIEGEDGEKADATDDDSAESKAAAAE
jgi:polyribonucleotide nucleotidyltransferase